MKRPLVHGIIPTDTMHPFWGVPSHEGMDGGCIPGLDGDGGGKSGASVGGGDGDGLTGGARVPGDGAYWVGGGGGGSENGASGG